MPTRPSPGQPHLGTRSAPTLQLDGLEFKDLDGDGQLAPYEDWRLSARQRAADLVSRMTLEEKAGLMLIDTVNAGWGGTVTRQGREHLEGQHMRRIIFRNVVALPGQETRGDDDHPFVAGSSLTPQQAARFLNAVQELAESSRLGIPVLAKSNARNHIDPDARAGINESHGAFSGFPKEAGLAAAALGAGSVAPVVSFAEVMGAEWRAIGLRGMYGYMVDLITEPRWYRTHECFSEDATLTSDIVTALLQTLQGPEVVDGSSLSPATDVALTIKHFPGGGPQERGLDPHYSFGKTQVYPGDNFGHHLEPFKAAVAGGAAAIMPYYGVPMNVTHDGVTYDHVGMAFSDQIVNGLLRGGAGFRGVCQLRHRDRHRACLGPGGGHDPGAGRGSDQLRLRHPVRVPRHHDHHQPGGERSGLFGPGRPGRRAVARPDVPDGPVREPLCRRDGTQPRAVQHGACRGGPRHTASFGRAAGEPGPGRRHRAGTAAAPGVDRVCAGHDRHGRLTSRGFTVVDGNAEDRPSAAGADHVLVSLSALTLNTAHYRSDDPATGLREDRISPVVFPGVRGLDGKSPYGAADAGVAYGAETCTDDGLPFGGPLPWESGVNDFTGMEAAESWAVQPSLTTIQQVMDEVGDPTKVVLDVYFRQPFVLDEQSGLREAGAIVATFGITDAALLDVLTGEFAPQGRMPFALAGSARAIEEQHSDLPGYDTTTDGPLYRYGHGLTFAARED